MCVLMWDYLLCVDVMWAILSWVFVCVQAEDGIRDLVRSRGLGDVYKRQPKEAPDAPGR